MKQIKAILESLSDSDITSEQLYEKASVLFDTKSKVDAGVMYIFPDGRMLGHSVDVGYHRPVQHVKLYDYIPDTCKNLDSPHFMFDPIVSKTFGIITVIPRSRECQSGRVVVPFGVTPTPEQEARITQIEKHLHYPVYRLTKQY